MTPEWQQAAERGDAAALARLLAQGADPDARDRHGQTALMLAARAGHVAAVRALVAAGADLDHTAKHRLSALMLACLHGHEEVVRALVEAGADVSLRGSGAPGFAGKTALDLARGLGHAAIVEVLQPGGG